MKIFAALLLAAVFAVPQVSRADEAEGLSFAPSGEIRMGVRTQMAADREGVTWSVRNSDGADEPRRAAIDSNGVLRGLYEGGIVVTCEDGLGGRCERQFTVAPPVLTIKTGCAYVMRSSALEAAAAGFPDAVFSFSVAGENGGDPCAAVSGSEIRGLAPGRVILTASTCINGTNASVSRVIEVKAPDTLEIAEEEYRMELRADRTRLRVGETAKLVCETEGMPEGTAILYDAEGSVAVGADGTVTAVKEGSGVITASAAFGGVVLRRQAAFTVTPYALILKVPAYAACGEAFSVEVVYPEGLSPAATEWAFDANALEMTDQGRFTPIRPGTVRIAASCPDGESSAEGECCVKAYSPQVLFTGNTRMRAGETAQLTAQVPGLSGDEVSFAWAAEGDAVELRGDTVAALRKGTATLLCTAVSPAFEGTLTCAAEIRVEDGPGAVYAVTGPDEVLSAQTCRFVLAEEGEGGARAEDDVMWSIAGQSFADIDREGRLTPFTSDGLFLGGSSAEVTVRAQRDGAVYEKKVRIVQAALSIAAAQDRVSLPEGAAAKIAVSVLPEGCEEAVEWESSDPDTAQVASDGTVRALRAGTARIEARCAYAGASFTVEVYAAARSLSIDADATEIGEGASVQMRAVLDPPDAQDRRLTWSSSDPDTACVDENGLVTALRAGTAVIKCETDGGTSASREVRCVVWSDRVAFAHGQADSAVFAVEEGGSLEVDVCVLPLDATYDGFTASSSDEEVVSAEGCVIYGLKEGTARVRYTAADGRSFAEATVIVKGSGSPAAQVKLDRNRGNMNVGAFSMLNAHTDPPGASVYWYSDDPGICAVDHNGLLEGVWSGSTTVHCVTEDGTEDTCFVTVSFVYPSAISIEPASVRMRVDEVICPEVAAVPENAVTGPISWKTDDPSVALVSLDGTVTAMGVGTCSVTAVCENGKRASCRITVTGVPVEKLFVASPYREILAGARFGMECGVSPDNATEKGVYWSSSDPAVIRPDRDGSMLTAMSAGECVLTAHAVDGSGCAVSVRMKVIEGEPDRFGLLVRNVTKGAAAVPCGAAVEADYGDELSLAADIRPVMQVTYSCSDPSVARVTQAGSIRTAGAGTCTVRACAGGLYERSFTLNVNTRNTSNYRVLVIGQYTDPEEAGYLTFSDNCVESVGNAFADSRIDGARYDVVTLRNIDSASEFTGRARQLADESKPGDVTVVYLLSHGVVKNGTYRWYLSGTEKSGGPYLTSSQIVSALSGIKGHVLLILTSCYSGGFANNVDASSLTLAAAQEELTGMVMASDKGGDSDSSLSLICSNTDSMKSSYVKTAAARSYEFFSLAVTRAFGRDMRTRERSAPGADSDGDGYVTLDEFADFTVRDTRERIDEYIGEYGSTGFVGNAGQTARGYISASAKDTVLFGID